MKELLQELADLLDEVLPIADWQQVTGKDPEKVKTYYTKRIRFTLDQLQAKLDSKADKNAVQTDLFDKNEISVHKIMLHRTFRNARLNTKSRNVVARFCENIHDKTLPQLIELGLTQRWLRRTPMMGELGISEMESWADSEDLVIP